MAEDSKHSSHDEEWYTDAPRGVKEVQTPQIEAQLSELTKVVMMLAKDKGVQPTPRACGICTQVGHLTDMCPQLQEEDYEEAKVMGGYSGANQRGYEQPRSDQQWNNNQGWGGNQQGNYQQNQSHQYQPRPPFPQNQPRPPFQPQNFQPRHPQQPPPQASSSSMSLEDIVKSLATSTQSFQQETKVSIKSLEQQVSQLAQSVSKMESQGKLPSQMEKNPKHNACAITLRGGKSYESPRMLDEEEEEEEKEIEVEEAVKEEEKKSTPKSKKLIESEEKVTPVPFPSRLASTKREREDDEIMAMFRKVEINIPLLDAITQIPRYAKFLKELCTSKKKLKENQTVKVGENVSAVLQKRLPKKCKDPSVFTVPCKMGNLFVPRAMLDLGASINVLPYSSYKTMGIRPLSKTGVIIQLADRSLVHPKELVFPADFYVLDMGDENTPQSSSILLGRPFMSTAKTKIDVANGTLSMEFDGEVINFNIFEAMHYPSDIHSLNFIDVIDSCTNDCFEMSSQDVLTTILSKHFDETGIKELADKYTLEDELIEVIDSLEKAQPMRVEPPRMKLKSSNRKLLPSIVQPPTLELKALPDHLKYAYLGEEETLPVIISTKLAREEEKELVGILKKYKEAIGWTIADIKGLSPSLCIHKILMEEDFKPTREA
ncbi:uncharacterized protein LOC128127808 [Lactuca sativa]|uniref:uncharacterized protein LOC128127808 n=1 Tax=Lactuca sativa TaxID=4236 RepID=UPI0022AEFC0E|nr:uncharacterized protein LOC128127808 [Lactuca sativa]